MTDVRLTILGSATSQGVPVIGCDCAACRSSDPRDQRLRNSAVFSRKGRNVVIDTGPDFRQQMLSGRITQLDGVLFTHEHNDHVAGLDDVRPFCFRQRQAIPLYAMPRVAKDLRNRYGYAFSDNPYPGAPVLDLKEISDTSQISLGGMIFDAIPVLHGKLPILGYRCGDKAYLTDVKALSPVARDQLRQLDVLVLSCLQREHHHSHLNLEEALEIVSDLQPKRTVLTHLSHRFGPHAELEAELPPGVEVGYDGMSI